MGRSILISQEGWNVRKFRVSIVQKIYSRCHGMSGPLLRRAILAVYIAELFKNLDNGTTR